MDQYYIIEKKIPRRKIWFKNIFKSFIWLIFPLCVYGDIQSCSSYIELGQHLTPYSVNVNGYYRSNGTYVRPYSRRPSGGVAHDNPYQNKRFLMGSIFIISLAGGIGSIIIYKHIVISEIEEYKEKIRNEELEKQRIIKEKKLEEEKIRNEQKRNHVKVTLEKFKNLGFSFNELCFFPDSLFLSQRYYKCKFCKKYITPNQFYVAFNAITKLHIICLNCLEARDSVGKNQPSEKFIPALYYAHYFNKKKEDFIKEFILTKGEFDFNNRDIENIFYAEINKEISNKNPAHQDFRNLSGL